jgi:hypothetical protein
MTALVAPVLHYLAEEIHGTLHEGDEGDSHLSVFARKWTPVVGPARFSLTFSPTA